MKTPQDSVADPPSLQGATAPPGASLPRMMHLCQPRSAGRVRQAVAVTFPLRVVLPCADFACADRACAAVCRRA